jgi:spermidine dehydrogenase
MDRKKKDNGDRRLGMGADITRRDFLNGTLLGTGAALVGAPAPARAQWPSVSDEDAWYGPGGVGEYASSHGNTPEVLRVARIVAAYEDVPLAELISETLRPILTRKLELHQDKKKKG